MAASLAADAVLLLHGVFILFVVAGGLLALRWPLAAAVHLPCAAWGAYIEFSGGICPLTPLEQRLRAAAGEAGYSGGFIEHYLLPLIYPAGLTPTVQIVLGSAVIVINLAVYSLVLRRRRTAARRP
jgi:hypothetical protein